MKNKDRKVKMKNKKDLNKRRKPKRNKFTIFDSNTVINTLNTYKISL